MGHNGFEKILLAALSIPILFMTHITPTTWEKIDDLCSFFVIYFPIEFVCVLLKVKKLLLFLLSPFTPTSEAQ